MHGDLERRVLPVLRCSVQAVTRCGTPGYSRYRARYSGSSGQTQCTSAAIEAAAARRTRSSRNPTYCLTMHEPEEMEALQRRFARDGFALLPGSVPLELALRAKEIVDAALAIEVPYGEPLPHTGHSRRSSPLYPGRIDLASAQFDGESVGSHPAIGELLTGGPLLSLLKEFIGGAEFTFERKDGSRGAPIGSGPGGVAGSVTVVFPCIHPPPSRVGCLGYPMNEIPEIILADGRRGGPWMGHLDGASNALTYPVCLQLLLYWMGLFFRQYNVPDPEAACEVQVCGVVVQMFHRHGAWFPRSGARQWPSTTAHWCPATTPILALISQISRRLSVRNDTDTLQCPRK